MLFVWGRFPVEVVAIGAALVLWATGVLTLQQSLAGFGDPIIIFIADAVRRQRRPRFDRCHGLGRPAADRPGRGQPDEAARADDAGRRPADGVRDGQRGRRGAAAGHRRDRDEARQVKPSKLLIPLCFGAHAGSQLGADRLEREPARVRRCDRVRRPAFGFFEFAFVGVPLRARHDRRSWRCSATGCCRTGRRGRSRRTSASTPGRSSASTGWPRAKATRPSRSAGRPAWPRSSSRRARRSSGSRSSRAWSPRVAISSWSRSSAGARTSGERRGRARGRRRPPAGGAVGGARREGRGSRRARRRPAGPRPPPGGAARPQGLGVDRRAGRHGRAARHRVSSRRRSPGCSRPAR